MSHRVFEIVHTQDQEKVPFLDVYAAPEGERPSLDNRVRFVVRDREVKVGDAIDADGNEVKKAEEVHAAYAPAFAPVAEVEAPAAVSEVAAPEVW